MAYFRKRGDKWSYTIDIGLDPITGKRRQATKGGFRTKKEAEAAAAKVVAEIADGTYIKENNILFEQFAQDWLDLYRSGGAKESSIRQRMFQVNALNKHFAKLKLRDITRQSYQRAILNMSKTNGFNTLSGIHGVARMIFRKALEYDVIKSDPTEYVKLPKNNNEDNDEVPKYMEKEQLAAFLKLAKERGLESDYMIFLTLAYTGMRVGELCALKWKDINCEAGTISINGTLYNPREASDDYTILTPKTKTSRRTIDVDPIIFTELETHRSRQNIVRMRHRKTYHDMDFVFARLDEHCGYPIKRRTIEWRMDRLIQMMDLPHRLTPHSLRHTHTSLLAEAGVSLEAIMKRLGHKDDRITRTVYLHVTRTVQKEASEKFGALMRNVVKM